VTQAIEPLVGPPHVEKLSDLRRRLNWGADLDPASPETWRDERSPAEVVRERIIGENTLRPIYYLHNALRAADAVVRIDVPGVGSGTGFLVAPDLMMTNHHVIADADQARLAEVSFFYELDIDKRERAMRTVGTADTPLLFTDKDLDVTLVRLEGPAGARALPADQACPSGAGPARRHHPAPGRVPQEDLDAEQPRRLCGDKLVQYYTSTQAGSSGSPVLRRRLRRGRHPP
jgi:hypothetical protein